MTATPTRMVKRMLLGILLRTGEKDAQDNEKPRNQAATCQDATAKGSQVKLYAFSDGSHYVADNKNDGYRRR